MEKEEHFKGQETYHRRFIPALRSQNLDQINNAKVESLFHQEERQLEKEIAVKQEKVIGFLGIEKYEIILYLSRILKQLGKKVLVLDCSENGALDAGVCYFREQPALYGELQEYRGIDYLNYTLHDSAGREEYSVFRDIRKEYDFILMDFGFRRGHPLYHICDHCFLVSDQQRHNILRMKEAALECQVPFTVVIRDILACKVSLDYFTDFMDGNDFAQEMIFLYRNEADTKRQIQCQYGQAVNFQKLSKETKEFLKQAVKRLLPDFTKAEIMKALKEAERGK